MKLAAVPPGQMVKVPGTATSGLLDDRLTFRWLGAGGLIVSVQLVVARGFSVAGAHWRGAVLADCTRLTETDCELDPKLAVITAV